MNPILGGTCKAVRDLIQGISLLDENIVNEVVCLDNPDEDFLLLDNFKIHTLGGGKTAWNYSEELFRWLSYNTDNYNKIIVHGLWQYQSFAVYHLWKKKKFDYSVMPHGMLDPYFQKARERRLKALRNFLFWNFIEKKLINNACGLFFTCEEEKLLARTTFKHYYPKLEHTIGLGIATPPTFTQTQTTAFAEKVKGWKGRPFLLFLSRIHQKKGIDLLLKAYLRLQDEFYDLPQLVIAGHGLETSYGQEIYVKAQAANLYQQNSILFSGLLSGDSKWGAFYGSECFILPSHQENFGIAIVESMACCKPVLITNKVNIWREIEGENGGIVDDDTEEAVYLLLKMFLSMSSEEKEEIGKNAFRVYQKYFSIETAAGNLIKALG